MVDQHGISHRASAEDGAGFKPLADSSDWKELVDWLKKKRESRYRERKLS
jgi:hypothetical protein